MDTRAALQQEVMEALFAKIAHSGDGLCAPVSIRSAQIYLSARHRDILFGDTPAETVGVTGSKGELEVPIVPGDAEQTRVEMSATEALGIGVRQMPVFDGTAKRGAPCVLRGSEGKVTLDAGVFAPQRRLCISPAHAERYGLTEGQRIWAAAEHTERTLIFEHVVVCIGQDLHLALYLDLDEASAAGLADGQSVRLLTSLP